MRFSPETLAAIPCCLSTLCHDSFMKPNNCLSAFGPFQDKVEIVLLKQKELALITALI